MNGVKILASRLLYLFLKNFLYFSPSGEVGETFRQNGKIGVH